MAAATILKVTPRCASLKTRRQKLLNEILLGRVGIAASPLANLRCPPQRHLKIKQKKKREKDIHIYGVSRRPDMQPVASSSSVPSPFIFYSRPYFFFQGLSPTTPAVQERGRLRRVKYNETVVWDRLKIFSSGGKRIHLRMNSSR